MRLGGEVPGPPGRDQAVWAARCEFLKHVATLRPNVHADLLEKVVGTVPQDLIHWLYERPGSDVDDVPCSVVDAWAELKAWTERHNLQSRVWNDVDRTWGADPDDWVIRAAARTVVRPSRPITPDEKRGSDTMFEHPPFLDTESVEPLRVEGWVPRWETESAFLDRVSEKAKQYCARIRGLDESPSTRKAIEKRDRRGRGADRHFRWLVLRQVPPIESPANIAASAGVTEKTVGDGIRRIRRLIGIPPHHRRVPRS